jgi:hypothetical protein
MLEDMRKYVRAGLEAFSSQGAEDTAGVIMSRASVLADQLNAFASGFLEWSAEARASLMQELRDVITRQVETMGLATKQDLEALQRRVDRLEGRSGGAATQGSRTGRSTARRASAPKATAASRGGGSSKAKASSRAGGSSKAKASGRKRSGGSRPSTSE